MEYLVIAILLLVVIVAMKRVGARRASRTSALPGALVAVPPPSDYRIDGETVRVYFDTVVPVGGADEALKRALARVALEVFAAKSGRLPMDKVSSVAVMAKQNGNYVEVTMASVGDPKSMGETEMATIETGAVGGLSPADPLSVLGATDLDLGARILHRGDELSSLAEAVRLPAKLVDGASLEVSSLSLEALVVGLLRYSEYDVYDVGSGRVARKGGRVTYFDLIEHEAGTHPELDQAEVERFFIRFMSSGADSGMLFTSKFAPYTIYEKERRDSRIKYIARERLQAFIDTVAIS